MQTVGQFDEDDPDVVGHGQQHFTDTLRLPGLGAVKGQLAQLGDAGDDMQDVTAEHFADFGFGGVGVLDDIVEQAGGDAYGIEFHVGQDAGHLKRMGEIGLAGQAHLAVVDPGRKDVGPVDDIHVHIRVVFDNFINDVGYSNH